MRRIKPPARKAALKRSTMKPHRVREQPGKKDAMRRFREEVCGAVDSPLEAHHCLKASWLKRYADRNRLAGADYWAVVLDPRIAIPLEHRAHEQHTSRVAVIPGPDLPAHVWEAAAGYGPEAIAALEREHPSPEAGA